MVRKNERADGPAGPNVDDERQVAEEPGATATPPMTDAERDALLTAGRRAFFCEGDAAKSRRSQRLAAYGEADRRRETARQSGEQLPAGVEGRRILAVSEHNIADLVASPAGGTSMIGKVFKAQQLRVDEEHDKAHRKAVLAAEADGQPVPEPERPERVRTTVTRLRSGVRSGDVIGAAVVRSFDADSYSEDGRSSTGNESRQSATLKAIVSFTQPLLRFTESAQNLINIGREIARRPRFAPDDPSVYMKLNAVVRLDGVREIRPTTEEPRKDDPSLPKQRVGAPIGTVADADAAAWAGTRPEGMLPFEEAPVRGGELLDALGISRDEPPVERPTYGEVLSGQFGATSRAKELARSREADYGLPRVSNSRRTIAALGLPQDTPLEDRPTFRDCLVHEKEEVRAAAAHACKGHVLASKGGIGADAVLELDCGGVGDMLVNCVTEASRGSRANERDAGSVSVDREGQVIDSPMGLVNVGSLSCKHVYNTIPRRWPGSSRGVRSVSAPCVIRRTRCASSPVGSTTWRSERRLATKSTEWAGKAPLSFWREACKRRCKSRPRFAKGSG